MLSRLAAVLVLLVACGRPAREARAPVRPPGQVPRPRPRPRAPAIKLATWNVKRLGEGEKRLDLVAEVIAGFDVVALQEVMRAEAVEELLQLLPGWGAAVSERAVGRNGYEELYAVLYRKDVAVLRRAALAADPQDDFAREPFVVCLDAAAFDFCLVTFHATYGGGARLRDHEIEAFGLLAMDLRDRGPEKDWIVAGDFNRPDTAPGFDTFEDAGWACTLAPAATPTTIGQEKYTNAYDHVLVDRRHTREWTGSQRFDLVAGPCTGDFRWCRDEVADHAPVVATFRTDGPDDD